MSDWFNYYDALQVSRFADEVVIEAAYKALLKKHHPDSGHTKGTTALRLREAYHGLTDARSRKRHNDEIDNHTNIMGKKLGEYVVESFIAEGGFGKTYKGKHVLTGGPVCIKHCSRIGPSTAGILVNETRAMEGFRHFGIPGVRTLTQLSDGSLALVMDFIEGPTLEQLMDKHKAAGQIMDYEHAAWILARLVNALSYIHRHGVVHGDLKPQNVIIQENSHLVVMVDFGLASIKPTKSSGNKGYTDVFAPPEQRVAGNPLIPQTDFYALGKTILYALAQGDLAKVERNMIPADVPMPMQRFIHRLVRTDPLDRPDWEEGDLNLLVEDMRLEAFGRRASGMKKFAI